MKMLIFNRFRHKKLVMAVCLVALLVVGFFVYKYSYIYLERKKYTQAEVAINKVADDLRSQGINTKFSRGCGRTQTVSGPGAIICSSGILYKGDEANLKSEDAVSAFASSVKDNNFTYNKSFNTSYTTYPQPTGISVYSLAESTLQCQIKLDSTWPTDARYAIILECSDGSRFNLF